MLMEVLQAQTPLIQLLRVPKKEPEHFSQWFTLKPILAKPFINTYFAGEHIAEWQGFMEGAINTGEEAAGMI